jgi:hypothetical protein
MSCDQGANFAIHNVSSDTLEYVTIKYSDRRSEVSTLCIPPLQTDTIFLDLSKTTTPQGHFTLISASINRAKPFRSKTVAMDFGDHKNTTCFKDTIDIFVTDANINFGESRP